MTTTTKKRVTPQEALKNLTKSAPKATNFTSREQPKPDLDNLQSADYKSIAANGLPDIDVNAIAARLPKHDALVIEDPLNPPENSPRQTDAQRQHTKVVYSEIINARESIGDANKAIKADFDARKEGIKAFGAGVQLATEVEKVRGNLMDYSSQIEQNKQKYVGLAVNQYKTAIEVERAVFQKIDLDAKLQDDQLKAELSVEKVKKSRMLLDDFKKQLGESKPK
ncbi:hypothetical protein [Anabaena sp. CCY 9402-a]|uniref:hypothetical protein n=1 Tax=Anabaena sp. CCY 9402-a TaxID=3103867 RepID=UPI0039C75F76